MGQKSILEIGFGSTSHAYRLAQQDKESQYIAIDTNPRWCEVLRMRSRGISNLTIIQIEGLEYLRDCVVSSSLHEIHMYYPTPYPLKSRLISPAFEIQCFRALKPSGTITIVTDHLQYFSTIADLFCSSSWLPVCWYSNTFRREMNLANLRTYCAYYYEKGYWIATMKCT